MRTTHVLIDLSYLAYRAMHTMKNLDYDDIPTGVLFGVFNQLHYLCFDGRVRSSNIHIFVDSKSSIRTDEYPEYKGQRRQERTPEEIKRLHSMRSQLNEFGREIMPALGVPTYEQDGMESDDLLASAALRVNANAVHT